MSSLTPPKLLRPARAGLLVLTLVAAPAIAQTDEDAPTAVVTDDSGSKINQEALQKLLGRLDQAVQFSKLRPSRDGASVCGELRPMNDDGVFGAAVSFFFDPSSNTFWTAPETDDLRMARFYQKCELK
jgi:hypothetical protein